MARCDLDHSGSIDRSEFIDYYAATLEAVSLYEQSVDKAISHSSPIFNANPNPKIKPDRNPNGQGGT